MSGSLRRLTFCGLFAAVYTVLTLVSTAAGLAFGPIQVRLSEALCILPVLTAQGIPALGVGCLVSNLIGLATGSPLGWIDLIVGTGATLIAAVLARLLRNIRRHGLPIASVLASAAVNAVLVGLELAFALGPFEWATFGWYALTVGVGELIACAGLGLPLFAVIQKRKLSRFFR